MSDSADIITQPVTDETDIFESIPSIVFENRTAYSAIQFNTVDQYDQPFHVFVVRQSFDIGKCNGAGEAQLIESHAQPELEVEDRYFDPEGTGSVAYESDLAPYKPKCDVIVNGTAHAPGGKPVREFPVRLQLHVNKEVLIDKALSITGERWFKPGFLVTRAAGAVVSLGTFGAKQTNTWSETTPELFTTLPLRYEYAVGGAARVRRTDPAADQVPKANRLTDDDHEYIAHEVSEENPLGRGFTPAWYLRALKPGAVEAPRISYQGKYFSASDFWASANGKKMPATAGFGIIGRAWLPRRRLAGTFVEKNDWKEDEVPRLPEDFDYGYWNCAPADQQCQHLRFGETFTLHNLFRPDHPSVRLNEARGTVLKFVLPQQAFFLIAVGEEGVTMFRNLLIDTVCIDTDAGRVHLVWRNLLDADGRFKLVRLMQVKKDEQIERLDIAESAGIFKQKPRASQPGERKDG